MKTKAILSPEEESDITLTTKDTVIKICEGGKIYIRGEYVADNTEVYKELLAFLRGANVDTGRLLLILKDYTSIRDSGMPPNSNTVQEAKEMLAWLERDLT